MTVRRPETTAVSRGRRNTSARASEGVRQPIHAPAEHGRTVEQRAANVRAGLSDPDVYALIDNELARPREQAPERATTTAPTPGPLATAEY